MLNEASRLADLVPVPRERWPKVGKDAPLAVWLSREFLVQQFAYGDGMFRLSVCRTTRNESGNWKENITWDELQAVKRGCGFGDMDALEIYPRDADIVNVANFRHLWVMPHPVAFAWRPSKDA